MDKIPLCTCGSKCPKHHQQDCAIAVWCREGLPSDGVRAEDVCAVCAE